MRRNGKVKKKVLITIILLSIATLTCLFAYNIHLRRNLSASSCTTLQEIMEQQKNNFSEKFLMEVRYLNITADTFAQTNFTQDQQSAFLQNIINHTAFDFIAVSDNQGNAIAQNGEHIDVSDNPAFIDAMTGKSAIANPFPSATDQYNEIYLGSPIIKNGAVEGTLVAKYNFENAQKVYLPFFDQSGFSYITDQQGNIITHFKNPDFQAFSDNLFDAFATSKFYELDDFTDITTNMDLGLSGHSKYSFEDGNRLMHYSPAGVNDWYIFSIVPEQIINHSANEIIFSAVIITLVILAIFIVFFVFAIRANKKHLNQLAHIAYVDELTGFDNFYKFKESAEIIVRTNPPQRYVVSKFDIKNFKLLNELYGFETGDQILMFIANSLNGMLDSKKETFARINSDEFIILSDVDNKQISNNKKQLFEKYLSEYPKEIFNFKIILPEGRYELEPTDKDFSEIYEKVNFAHKLAKQKGLDLVMYDSEIKALTIKQKEIENKMEDALINMEYKVYLQPKYRLRDEKIIGVEALVRWKTEQYFIYPDEFIPMFERNNFILKLDMYMFKKSCEIIRKWIDLGYNPVCISVNFSRLHLNNPNFVEELCAIANNAKAPHNLLEIELTESAIFENTHLLADILTKLHENNFTLSMDDFGAGYSSLGLLKDIPVDVIKIDKEFFNVSKDKKRAKYVIASIINMAKTLKIVTVAEGIETKENIEFLTELNCDIVQGYYFAKPMPEEEFTEILKNISE